jgi:acetyl-CoA carboxylase biotin carboxyl carrier protein
VKKVKRPVQAGGTRSSAVGEPIASNRARPEKDDTGLLDEHSRSIQTFIDLLKQHNLAELEFEREGFRIRLKRESGAGSPLVTKSDNRAGGVPPQTDSQTAAVPEHANGMVTITSPIVGTFYRSPSPDADPYVEEGDVVKKGQVLCIVEAMKLMNEIEADASGEIVRCLVTNGQAIEYGQPLFSIRG